MDEALTNPNKLLPTTPPDPTFVPDDYPLYPVNEDIYEREKEAVDIDPEDTAKVKVPNEPAADEVQALDANLHEPGSDLDVPGAELDDTDEAIGNEDEENNYYSLGGDDHNNLDEDID